MSTTDFAEKYISTQWASFLDHAVLHLDKAARVYAKNKTSDRGKGGSRILIANSENFESSSALVACITSLEGFANAVPFQYNLEGFNRWKNLTWKVKNIGITYPKLLIFITELTVCRDAVIHGHIWLKSRKSDGVSYDLKEVRSYMWKPFKTSLDKKFNANVNWKKRQTNLLHLHVIPIDISFLDGLKALKVLTSVLEDFYRQHEVSWRPAMFPHKQEGFSQEAQTALYHHHKPTEWVKYFESKLNKRDLKEYTTCTENLP